MNQFLRGMVQAVVESFPLPGPVLEIGSYQVEGQGSLIDLRSLFADRQYIGLDMRPGPGVDLVGNVEKLDLPDASVGTVLALSTFEHVKHFWRGLDEVYRVLRPDGALVLSCPFYFHVHAYPSDYWRFTPEALRVLLERYPSKVIGWHGPTRRPLDVWAVAFREKHPAITAEQYETYRAAMNHHAREPLGWKRRLVFTVGRMLCGSRPFAPWLEREKWQSECVNAPQGTAHADHAGTQAPERRSA